MPPKTILTPYVWTDMHMQQSKSCKKFGVISTKLSTSIFESFNTKHINQSLKNISFIVPGAEEVAEPGASTNTTRVSQCLLFLSFRQRFSTKEKEEKHFVVSIVFGPPLPDLDPFVRGKDPDPALDPSLLS
jgi:hypothetical protein